MNLLEKFSVLDINKPEMMAYINFCQNNSTTKIKGKTSHHHILPSALFLEFSDLTENDWNGVHLTYANHYTAHYLLTKAIDDFGQLSAFIKMNNCDIENGKLKEEDLISPEEFQRLMELRSKKHREYMQIIEENGLTKAVNTVTKSANTMKEIQEDGMTIYEKANLKQHNTKRKNGTYKEVGKKMVNTKRNDIDSKGLNGLQRHSIKSANTMKEIQEDGMTIYEKSTVKRLDTIYKNQKKYNIVNIDGNIYREGLYMKEVKEVSGSLPKTDKEKYLGKSKSSLSALKRNKSEHLFGLYIEKIK